MHCASCSARIEKQLNKTKGVDKAVVNIATESANVEYDKEYLTKKQINEIIKKLGFGVVEENIDISVKKSKLDTKEEAKKKEISSLKRDFIVAATFSLPLFLISMPLMMLGMMIPYQDFILLALATPVQFYAGLRFYKGAFAALKTGSSNMDTLVALGTSAAYFYSLAVMLIPELTGAVYFESSAVIITFILLGKYMEVRTKGKTGEAIKKLIGLKPKIATIIRIIDGKEKEMTVDTEKVIVGDIVIVKPGEKVPADGSIIFGSSSIDESMITGESIPVTKNINDNVIGGTINKHGSFKFKATKVGKDTMLSGIIKLVEEAQGSKSEIQKIADKVSSIFVPAVLIIALISFSVWFFILGKDFTFALTVIISVLIISCPCSLGLATPTAIIMGTGLAAKRGILIKDANALEQAHKLDVIVFDKTGTLTKGKPEVTAIIGYNKYTEKKALQLAASIEKPSEHSLAEAILNKAMDEKLVLDGVDSFKAIPGKGVSGVINSKKILFGNRKTFTPNEMVEKDMVALEEKGNTVMMLSVEKDIVGIIAVADRVKEDSKSAISKLKEMGKRVIMLTGDNSRTAKAIAKELGIKESNVISDVLPADKEKEIIRIQGEGKIVAMIGDGINDSPALARSDVGIALGAGTDVAIESASIVLINDKINDVVSAIKLSNYTVKKIKQNLFWAFFYNSITIPLAAGVFYGVLGFLLHPMVAGAAMAFSSVSVVSNSLLMKLYKEK